MVTQSERVNSKTREGKRSLVFEQTTSAEGFVYVAILVGFSLRLDSPNNLGFDIVMEALLSKISQFQEIGWRPLLTYRLVAVLCSLKVGTFLHA